MIESNPLLSQKMQNWSHLLVKTCARRDSTRGDLVSARNLKRRVLKGAWRRTGNLLIVSSFVTKRATVFKYSVNGIYRGEGNFSTETGAASNLRKLSRNKFCIHPRDTFHSRRLPRTRGGTLIPCLASLPFHGPWQTAFTQIAIYRS